MKKEIRKAITQVAINGIEYTNLFQFFNHDQKHAFLLAICMNYL